MKQRFGLKGFRDFFGDQVKIREKIRKTIREVFERFGFEPLETPVLERAELLTGKYGQDADKLIYLFQDRGGREVGLRYDLTLPACRVVAEYLDKKISLPYKRYQIQDVFRAEKPQRGRLRQFTQADIDIFGSSSSYSSAEIIACLDAALKELGFSDYVFLINSRKLAFALLEDSGFLQKDFAGILRIVDKLDKKPLEQVKDELIQKYGSQSADLLQKFQQLEPDQRLQEIISWAKALGVAEERLRFSGFLVRGLDYYTDEVFEVKMQGQEDLGSLAGGGRYDDLLERIAGRSIPAVGGSLGFERIFEIFAQKEMRKDRPRIFAVVFSKEQRVKLLPIVKKLREKGLEVQTALEDELDLRKQLKFADRKGFDYVLFFADEEQAEGVVKLKKMSSGEQIKIGLAELEKYSF